MSGAVLRAALVAALGGCAQPPPPPPSAPGAPTPAGPTTTVPAGRARKTNRPLLLHWLQCYECTDGELDSVVALGKARSSGAATIDTLRRDLYAGPSAERRANVRRQLDATYIEDSTETALDGEPMAVTRAAYVGPLLDNFVSVWRIRAAKALSRIGGPAARAALDFTLTAPPPTRSDTLRRDTRRALQLARDSVGH